MTQLLVLSLLLVLLLLGLPPLQAAARATVE
jgi:hypothetical protein